MFMMNWNFMTVLSETRPDNNFSGTMFALVRAWSCRYQPVLRVVEPGASSLTWEGLELRL